MGGHQIRGHCWVQMESKKSKKQRERKRRKRSYLLGIESEREEKKKV